MSSSKNNNERESYWKSPILIDGEYDLWSREFETHVRSIDGEIWKIITSGDLQVTQNNGKPVDFTSFTAEDWTKDEKNMKALNSSPVGLTTQIKGKFLKVSLQKTSGTPWPRSTKVLWTSSVIELLLFSQMMTALPWEKRRA